jgi:putative mRNA 3-end processing factor
MSRPDLVIERPEGLYVPAADVYIDPWRPVHRALITHAHADHARWGHQHYLCAAAGEHVMRVRLGNISLQTLPYGQGLRVGDAVFSFYPAGHVLGSAQIRIEVAGQVWVVSGDYKLQADPTCAAFEPVACHSFVTESTFGLPIYRWQSDQVVFDQINAWWRANQQQGLASVLYCYSFGKAQRLLKGVDANLGPIVVHGAVNGLNQAYRSSGVQLPATLMVSELSAATKLSDCLVIAPPSVAGSSWLKRFGAISDAFASGWMLLRGARRRRSLDRGFVLSDHADWPGLQQAIKASGAQRVVVTHGYEAVMIRWLQEQGLQASAFQTEFGEDNEAQQEALFENGPA